MNETWEGWHFCATTRRLGYEDGRLITPGETLTVNCKPVLCKSGLHASKRAIDALRYASGPIICRVRLSGDVVIGDDKACATERHTVWMADATEALEAFARWCALQVIHLWDAPAVVQQYLETGDESLRADAWAATAQATIAGADNDAVTSAAWACSDDLAIFNANYAMYLAKYGMAAGGSAARNAAITSQNNELERLLWALQTNTSREAP